MRIQPITASVLLAVAVILAACGGAASQSGRPAPGSQAPTPNGPKAGNAAATVMPSASSPVAGPAVQRALVLSGGGQVGRAWEIGIIKGLKDAGIDLTQGEPDRRDVRRSGSWHATSIGPDPR